MEKTQKMIDILQKKLEHIKKINSHIKYLAENKVNQTFFTGKCSECEKYDNEILELLKN